MARLLRSSDKIDITQYLPPFLKKDPHFRAVCEACSWEHENIRNAILDALNQFFVKKATWGLSMWERVLDLHPGPEDTYKQRRKKVHCLQCKWKSNERKYNVKNKQNRKIQYFYGRNNAESSEKIKRYKNENNRNKT